MVEGPGRLRVGIDAHTVGRRQTGSERYAVELSRALAADPQVQVIAYVDPGVAWPQTAGAPGLRVRRLRSRNRWARIAAELPYRARRDRLDLLPEVSRARLRLTTRLAAARSAAFLVPSSFTRDRLLARFAIDPERVHVAPDGVSPHWTPTGEETQKPLPALPERFVLTIGTQHPRRNLPRVLAAVDRARRAGAGDLGLVLVGPDGPGSREVDETICRLGAQTLVQKLGFISDRAVAALYDRALVVVYASLYEGFGLPVLEAMAAGAPVVASNTTSIPEVAGEAALLVDPTNVAAVADAIGRVATDPELRERLIVAGRERAAQFSCERCAAATVEAYRAALA